MNKQRMDQKDMRDNSTIILLVLIFFMIIPIGIIMYSYFSFWVVITTMSTLMVTFIFMFTDQIRMNIKSSEEVYAVKKNTKKFMFNGEDDCNTLDD